MHSGRSSLSDKCYFLKTARTGKFSTGGGGGGGGAKWRVSGFDLISKTPMFSTMCIDYFINFMN